MRNDTLVLLPTYNEIENLPRILPEILTAAPVDVMILDDSSPDGTGALADQLAAADERVTVVHRPQKEGLGRAYRDGFSRALAQGYDFIFEMDADFSHPPPTLPKMLEAARAGADLVLGSRWVRGGGTEGWPVSRTLISRGGSLYARLVLGVDVKDLTGGFKCFRREVLETLLRHEIQSLGYSFQIELTYRAIQAGFKVKEVPFVFVERQAGASKMSGAIFKEAFLVVWKLRFSSAGMPPTRRVRASA
ncbi:polyprenol monophosphomannose synthase [Planctomycetota bacterium]